MSDQHVRRERVAFRGVEVDVAEHGEGPDAVVLMPGGAVACDPCFPGLVAALAPHSRVVVHDRVGSGASPAGGAEVSVRAWADDTIHLLDTLGIDRAVLVGHSLGGALAAFVARAQPHRVAGAVLLDPTPINDASTCAVTSRAAGYLGALGRRRRIGPAMAAGIKRLSRPRRLSPEARAAYDATFVGGWLVDTAESTRTLPDDAAAFAALPAQRPDGPVVVISAGRKETHRFQRAHVELAALLGGRFEVWPGTQHSLHLQRPDSVIDLVRDVIEESKP